VWVSILNDHGPNTGISRYAWNLALAIRQHGDEAELVQFATGSAFRGEEVPGVVVRGTRSIIPGSLEASMFLGLAGRRLIGKAGGRVLHLSSPTLLRGLPPNLRCVVTVHDLYYLHQNSNSRLYSWFNRRCLRLVSRAAMVFADSNFVREQAIAEIGLDPRAIYTLYPPVDTDFFSPGPPLDRHTLNMDAGSKLLLSVGYDNQNKNIQVVFRALKQLPPAFHLLRVGTTLPATRRLAVRLGIEGRVRFLESVSNIRLRSLYRSADAVVQPSLYEGFGYPVVEALSCGARVVSSNTSSLPEVGGGLAITADPTDVSAWTEAINRAADLPSSVAYLQAARAQVERFSFAKQSEQAARLYARFEGSSGS
jgi:glycosyltransferase involved in cell wall biosynthesis